MAGSVFVGRVNLADGLGGRRFMWRRWKIGRKGIIHIGLGISELLREVPNTERDLSVPEEMVRQLPEYRFVLEILAVDLLEIDIPWTYEDAARRGAGQQRGALGRARDRDGPPTDTCLLFVKHAQHVVEDAIWIRVGDEPQLFGERVRVVAEQLGVDEARVGRRSGVIGKECAGLYPCQIVSVVLQSAPGGGVVGTGR